MADNTARLRAVLDDKVSGPLERIRDSFDRLGGRGSAASLFGNVGAKAIAGGFNLIGDAASGAITYVQGSIQAASNLNEAVSKNQAVFKEGAAEIDKWAAGAADAFGQSKRQALEAAGTFGNLIQAFGLGADQAANMSTKMTELASDLASFNNTTVDEALLALRSGLTGETEPLKRFGVALNDARLKEEALRLGLIKTAKGTLPVAIKTQAAYSLILKDTTLAQGDFARTSDGLANSQKTLDAQLEDLSATLGAAIIPKVTDTVQLISALTKAVNESTKAFGALGPEAEQAAGAFVDVVTSAFRPDKIVEFAQTIDRTARGIALSLTTTADRSMDAIESKRAAFGTVTNKFSQELPEALEEAQEDAVAIARATPQALADGLRDERAAWQLALDTLGDDLEDEMTVVQERAKLKAALAGEDLAKGLKSKDPVVRAQAEATRKIIVDRLTTLDGFRWGDNLGESFARGIRNSIIDIQKAARLAAKTAADYLEFQSPARKGPGSEAGGPEGWGRNLGKAFSKGVAATMPDLVGASASLVGGAGPGSAMRPASAPVVVHSHLYLDGYEIAAAVEAAQYYPAAVSTTATGPA